jgi:transcriptional regulator of arginine metabolism
MRQSKKEKQGLVKKIIEEHEISSQTQLAEELAKCNAHVDQSTLSRYIREMNLVKVPHGLGKSIYQIQPQATATSIRIFQSRIADNVTGMTYSEDVILIKTIPGEALSLARVLDEAQLESVLGTVAGYDTILVLVDGKRNTKKVFTIFEKARKMKLESELNK